MVIPVYMFFDPPVILEAKCPLQLRHTRKPETIKNYTLNISTNFGPNTITTTTSSSTTTLITTISTTNLSYILLYIYFCECFKVAMTPVMCLLFVKSDHTSSRCNAHNIQSVFLMLVQSVFRYLYRYKVCDCNVAVDIVVVNVVVDDVVVRGNVIGIF